MDVFVENDRGFKTSFHPSIDGIGLSLFP